MSASKRIYLGKNVLEAALDRVRWLFDEFPNITVNFSGGKDSTVVLHLALMVAEEKGRLPLRVMFLDQEAEWQTVIDYIRTVMADPRVDPQWVQVPFRMPNSTTAGAQWLHAWEPGAQWIRPKEPGAITENVFGADLFYEMFPAILRHYHPNEPACRIAGVRCEESPARLLGLTTYETYKGETWGKKEDVKRGHYTFYPIYDWSYTDVWKAIHEHGWPYCRLYDFMYQHGVKLQQMRVSNVHHETALKSLFFLQEIEPDTWNRITDRLQGINTVGQLKADFFAPKELPFMFRTWAEYRDHLLENLIPDHVQRAKGGSAKEFLRETFRATERLYQGKDYDDLIRTHITMVLTNDYEDATKLSTFQAAKLGASKNRGKNSGRNEGKRQRQ